MSSVSATFDFLLSSPRSGASPTWGIYLKALAFITIEGVLFFLATLRGFHTFEAQFQNHLHDDSTSYNGEYKILQHFFISIILQRNTLPAGGAV